MQASLCVIILSWGTSVGQLCGRVCARALWDERSRLMTFAEIASLKGRLIRDVLLESDSGRGNGFHSPSPVSSSIAATASAAYTIDPKS